jgi:hypothetical protein
VKYMHPWLSRLALRPHVDLLRLGVGVLEHCHVNPLGLDACGPGSDDHGVSGRVVDRSAFTATPQTCPWQAPGPARSWWQ